MVDDLAGLHRVPARVRKHRVVERHSPEHCAKSEVTVVTATWSLAALWLGLALAATLLSIWLRIATALSEIVVGIIAQLILGALIGGAALDTGESWVQFLSGTGAIVLTFLAGAELDPIVVTQRTHAPLRSASLCPLAKPAPEQTVRCDMRA